MKKIINILILVLIIMLFSGCDDYGKKIKEDLTEKIIENIIGDGADVDITYPSETQPSVTADIESEISDEVWPNDIPVEVPVCEHDISNTIKTPNGIIIDFGITEQDIVTQYIALLEASAFQQNKEKINEDSIECIFEKENITVNIYWYSGGSFTLLLVWK